MSPIEASTLLATLVGLICNWKQERSAQATDRFQDFMVWLSHHQFEGLRERIYDSEELQRELSALLQQDLSVLSSKLDLITGAISAVADKIDRIGQVSRALGADTEALSDQAVALIKAFEESGDGRMVFSSQQMACVFDPSGRRFSAQEPRFLEADVESLAIFRYVELVDQNGHGDPIYALTRGGSRFAATQLDSAEIQKF
jgi:hypothetical protein